MNRYRVEQGNLRTRAAEVGGLPCWVGETRTFTTDGDV